MKTVCWYETTCAIEKVPNGKYSVYIRHAVSSTIRCIEKFDLAITVKGLNEDEDKVCDEEVFFQPKFPTEEQAGEISSSFKNAKV
jgi:hypothetical protein